LCVNKFNCQNVYVGNEEHWLITGWVNIKNMLGYTLYKSVHSIGRDLRQ